MNKKHFPISIMTGCALGMGFLITITGCVGYVRGPSAGVYVDPSVQVNTGFAVEDDYVYYPGYEMYYGSRTHRWYNHEGSAWVASPAPRGVSVEVLHSAPSVPLDFHDSPAAHHAQVVKTYPKNWKPSGGNPGQREDNQR